MKQCAFVALGVLASAFASPVLAQSIPNVNAPRQAAQRAVDATDRKTSEQTGQAMPVRRGAAAPAPAPTSGPGSAAEPTSSANPSTLAPGIATPVTREVFSYEPTARRDPFFSLILTEDLRPLLSDLRLVGILHDASGRRSVAIMRDVLTNAQYRVNAGMQLGRMRVAQIKPRVVIFTIDEFGLSRQDSLFLVDSTKVRIR